METYKEQIDRAIRKAKKEGNAAAFLYYSERRLGTACSSFERFKGSWAGRLWMASRGFAVG